MDKSKKIKDIMNITSGIFSSIEGVKSQSKELIKSKIASNLESLNFISRDEFNEFKAMIMKIREQNESLEKKIKNLEKKIKNL